MGKDNLDYPKSIFKILMVTLTENNTNLSLYATNSTTPEKSIYQI